MLNEDTRLLLARCRRGDAEAQSELLRAIQPRLYFYCLKMLKDERRAQETERKIFCEVLNGLSELKNDEDFPLRTVSTAARLCRAAARNAAPEQADSAPLTRSNNNFLEAFYHTGSFPVNLSGQKSRSFRKSVGQGMFRAEIICINIETPAVYAVERGAMVIGMVDLDAP